MNEDQLKILFNKHFGTDPDYTLPLPPTGSNRKYFRMGVSNGTTAIGAFNEDVDENRAFISYSKHFRSKDLPVPDIYFVSEDSKYYLMEDLGDLTLREVVEKSRSGDTYPDHLVLLYKKALEWLIKFQIHGHRGLDYSVSFPRESFDKRSIIWDLNHFKYFFLKLSHIPYSENRLEDDFQALAADLDKIDREYFMFRDFQWRNIMIRDNELYFIDYQGGRRGALQYDLASILFEARADLPPQIREQLYNHYIKELSASEIVYIDKQAFRDAYMKFALVRQLQAMGAYGLRGWIEGKPLFIQSIGYAVKNLKVIITDHTSGITSYPELYRVLTEITRNKRLMDIHEPDNRELTVSIYSFSYYRGIPDDLSGHGGGFVFDCRHILNPGGLTEYRQLTGLDRETELFFLEKTRMGSFLNDVFSIIDRTVENYRERDFRHLQVCFGCTGGRHRSVYAAMKLYEHLRDAGVKANIQHLELNELK